VGACGAGGAGGVGGFGVGVCVQGFGVEGVPVMSSGDDGMSHRFLFCLQARSRAFFSSHPCLCGGAGAGLLQGVVVDGAGWG
jgi:hypothetical protein